MVVVVVVAEMVHKGGGGMGRVLQQRAVHEGVGGQKRAQALQQAASRGALPGGLQTPPCLPQLLAPGHRALVKPQRIHRLHFPKMPN